MSIKLVGRLLLGLSLTAFSSAFSMEWQQFDLMRQAIQETNYQGEYIHRRGDKTNVYGVVHRFKNGKSEELLKQLDGDMVEVLRTDGRLVCYYPEGSEGALSHAIPAAPYSQVNALELSRIAGNYRASSLGVARVAGLQTHIIELKGDEWRYSHRFWLETDTNLLLQSEIVDSSGSVLEQFRYTRIELTTTISDLDLIPSLEGTANVRQQTINRTEQRTVDESSFLTRLSWVPDGYQLTNASRKDEIGGWVEQRTYSDGLTSFSVFVEQKQAGSQSPAAVAKMGATIALMTTVNGLSVTVIGEVPSNTAKQVTQMLSISKASL